MFNNRKRSIRKGPPFRQIYVPHDQREINQQPIPITNDYQAQYYLEQLRNKGYLTPPAPTPPDYPLSALIIKRNTANTYLEFDMNEDQSCHDINWNIDNVDVFDVSGNLLDKTKNDIPNIINRNGYKIFPIIATDHLAFRNGISTSFRSLKAQSVTNTTVTNIDVDASATYVVPEHYPSFTEATVSYYSGYIVYTAHNYINNWTVNIISGPQNSFYARCYQLLVLISPTQ